MAIEAAVETTGITKAFGRVEVLKGIDLTVARGSVVALLGPNGAGKTTLVRLLATLSGPDAGTARVLGHDVVTERDKVRRVISLTGQYAAVDELLTGEENLRMMGRLSHLRHSAARQRAAELLDEFDLVDARHRPVKTYSGGMRRRLDIAVSLIGRPEVLFLDEPTTGLDPRSRATMWDVVRRLVDEGVTVLLTTQYLDEADHLADRIAVIDEGLIVAQGTSAELKAQVGGQRIDLVLPDQCAYDDATHVLGDEAVRRDQASRSIGVATQGSAAEVRTLLDRLDQHGVRVDSLSMHTTTLDEVFLSLTGRPRDDSTLEVTHV